MRTNVTRIANTHGWMRKISLVLIFTMLFSTFMHQGWYNPKPAQAAVVTYYMRADNTTNLGIDGVCNLPAGAPSTFTSYPAKTTLATTEAGTGSRYYPAGFPTAGQWYIVERLYAPVYAVTAMDISNISASFAIRPANAADQVQINLYDYDPAGVAGNKTLVATGTAQVIGAAGTTVAKTWTAGNFTIAGTGRVALNHRLLVETSYLYQGTAGVRFYFGIAGATTSTNITVTETAVLGDSVNVADGTDPANYNVARGSTNNVADSFTMVMNANTGSVTGVTASLTNSANISGIRLYKDNGVAGTYEPVTDTLLSTGTPGASVSFTGFTENLTTTASNYLILVDVASGATLTQTVVASVTALTVTAPDAQGTITDTGATLTIIDVPHEDVGTALNTAIATSPKNEGTLNVLMQRFQVTSSTSGAGAQDNQLELNSLGIDDLGTATGARTAKAYIDTTSSATLPGTAVLIGSVASWTGTPTSITLNQGTAGDRTVANGTPKYIYIVYDLPTGATQTVQSSITSVGVVSPDAGQTGLILNSNAITLNAYLSSTITSCAGCHGYTTTFSDGTARNTPAGTIVGSHNTHVIKMSKACNVCHVTPATFGHRNSNIEMNSGATAIDGGYYDKNNNSGYDAPGDITFAQSNSSAMSTCRTVYCHSEGTGATLNSGDTRPYDAPVSNLNWGTTGTCGSCHGFGPSYANGTPKANSHAVHRTSCSTCHNSTTTDGTTITGPANHVNKTYEIVVANGATIGAYAYNVNGGTCTNISCHRPAGGVPEASRQWGTTFSPATDYECVDCHAQQQAITVGPAAGGTRGIVTGASGEFGLAWGHKRSGRLAVNDQDCIVCHLEGQYQGGVVGNPVLRASYHGDGYIDLRDPDVQGETRITDISLASFRFAKFSTSYAAGSRTSTGHLSNNIDNVLTQKFCIPCHDGDGALNTTARSNNGGTGTAAMPFGGIALGATYTAANGAIGTQGLVDVKTQFATTNTSFHPVRGPRNKDFPTAARLASPYNNIAAGRTDAGHGLANSVVLNCFDCHNAPTTPLTDRTIVAHGNANTIRGTIYVTGPTLCITCHTGYTTDTDNHLAGSAGSSSGTSGQNMFMSTFCMYCHASADAKPARPLPAQDFHGYNRLVNNATWTGSAATGGYPYGFIRNTSRWIAHKPYNSVQWGVTTATCQGDGTHCAANGGTQPYTPGGTY